MPATREQQAWVDRVLLGGARRAAAPAAPVEPAAAPVDPQIAAFAQAPSLGFQDLAALLGIVSDRVAAAFDPAGLSQLAAAAAPGASGGPAGYPPALGLPDLAATLSDLSASVLASVDAAILTKIAEASAGSATAGDAAAPPAGTVFSDLAVQLDGVLADVASAFDVTALSKLAAAAR